MFGTLPNVDLEVLPPGHAAVPSCLALAVERMNDALKRDPITILALVSMRMPCGEALAADDCPMPVAAAGSGHLQNCSASALGLINAALSTNGLRVAIADGSQGVRFAVVRNGLTEG